MSSIYAAVTPVIETVTSPQLQSALANSFERAAPVLEKVEQAFESFAAKRSSPEAARTFMKSWHSTHLKMLPIYGLTCRLHKLAIAEEVVPIRDHYFMAATRNAATSHEDLSVDAPELRTHAKLFDDLAAAVCGDDGWRRDAYNIPEAVAFQEWIYNQMVYAPVETGLLTNMFSEIYNHGEYSSAMLPFEGLLERLGHDRDEARRLGIYIRCHVDSNVEEAHFNSVVTALDHYNNASGNCTAQEDAERLFDEYLERSGAVMDALQRRIDALH
jgi:hypothetical protein